MHCFILVFHKTKFYFVPFVVYEIKLNLLPPMLISYSFIFLKTMYTWFHLNETLLLSLFINSLLCYKKSLRYTPFNKNVTPIILGVA
jgi:hypothetical protein